MLPSGVLQFPRLAASHLCSGLFSRPIATQSLVGSTWQVSLHCSYLAGVQQCSSNFSDALIIGNVFTTKFFGNSKKEILSFSLEISFQRLKIHVHQHTRNVKFDKMLRVF